jgi:acyl-CoA synthetase (NDP forming)
MNLHNNPADLHAFAPRELYGAKELSRLLRPRSIAVIGASATPGSFGYRTLQNTAFGYTGKVYAINPKHDEILGRACYPTIESLPEVPDCVVLSVPGAQALPIVEQCAALGVGGAVIYSSGFLETGDSERVAQQHRLVAIARQSGMRILGPNCIGIMNFVDRVGLSFQPGLNELPMITGPIGLVVQSGALGFIITQGMQRGIGFSYNIAPGNSCDVDICDLINFMVEDETTKAIACVCEGISDGARFLEAARRALAAGKPLIAYKMGRNDLSRRTALSHTGTLTGSNAAYDAAFERAGVVRVDDFEAVLETAAFFSKAGKPVTRGIGVMSASGGAAVMAADKADELGVSLPPLAPQTSAKLREKMPDFGSSANPCDITAASLHDHTMYGHCIEAFAADPSFAAVVVPMFSIFAPATVERAKYLCEVAAGLDKPLCIVWLNEWLQGPGSEVYDGSRELSMFRSMGRCLATLKSWIDYHERREGLLSRRTSRLVGDHCAANARVLLAGRRAGETLSEGASKALLASYGIPVTREKLVLTEDEAVRAAAAIGYPVVLKAASAAIAHKTEAGVVHLALSDEHAVRTAYRSIQETVARLPGPPPLAGVSVQEMVGGGIEVMAGVRNDPQFGPLVVCGMGGVLVEVLRDTASALAPVSKAEALDMLRSLKGYKLLAGFRGAKPVALDALAEAIARISELASDQRERLAELDVNPIVASADRVVAVDALAVIAGTGVNR